ncbi:MAG: cytochrome c [Mongoliibacter sp.]|uniref:cytochrome c n=1 Tax=Mongoliibacter sp. TaxID=2022438 RepID=UPI0012F3EA42|nr:cytochrome c [Mongoliibacter sp.]TVP44706.1 MAG: cytochrome c [Mongoliibacter sp.]
MNTASAHTSSKIDASYSKAQLAKPWMRWAVFFFLSSAVFGLLMRYFFIGTVPESLDYKHILHAHSHVALLGWGYLLVSGAMVFLYIKDPERLKVYKTLLVLTVIANLGMLISFPFQGYGLYSISFSTMHLLVSYGFGYHFLKDLKKCPQGSDNKLLRLAVFWLLASSLGLWAVAPVGAIFGKLHPLYFLSVQWFLHFQLNGWFVYGFLGLFILFLKKKKIEVGFKPVQLFVLNLSLVLTFALTISWAYHWEGLYYLNSIGVILQAIAYSWILYPGWKALITESHLPINWVEKIVLLGLISIIAKALIQLALVIPDLVAVSFQIRNYIIGFIHLVLLGTITFGIGGICIDSGLLPQNKFAKAGWFILSAAFVSSEVLLFGQGTILWAKMGFIPNYHLFLFISSAFFPLGLSLIFGSLWQKQHKMDQNFIMIKPVKIVLN